MTNFKIEKHDLNFGKACDWYSHGTAAICRAFNVRTIYGQLGGYFVMREELDRSSCPYYPARHVSVPVAGPYSSEEVAQIYIDGIVASQAA